MQWCSTETIPEDSVDLLQQRDQSLWQKLKMPSFSSLQEDLVADVCVIGGGIAGLTTAYLLLKEGRSVVVVDRDQEIGRHETGLSTGHVTCALDDRFFQLRHLHGEDGMRLAGESHRRAVDEVEALIMAEGIRCDFERLPGYLFLGPRQNIKYLETELEAARVATLLEVELLDHAPIPFFDTGPCLVFPNQGQFHPVKYLTGLARAIVKSGGRIFTRTPAVQIEGGHPARVHIQTGQKILCEDVVVATNVPFNDRIVMQTKLPAYRTYVIGIEVPSETFPSFLLWDSEDPYHYVRLVRDDLAQRDILIVGGEDHRTGHDEHPEKRFAKLKEWTETRLNIRGRLAYKWSGQIIEPVDGLAYIGRNPGDESNVYIASGDSGNGLTHGTIAGLLLRDLILNRSNPWTELYDPARINLNGLGTYMKEAFSSTAPYTDWLTIDDVESVDEISPGEGAVLRDGLRKVAVFRDEIHGLHTLSATCPHLGGVVRWNSAEKTWDCPCHGSRFNRFGDVLNGPAPVGLKPTHLSSPTSDNPRPQRPPPSREEILLARGRQAEATT